MFGLIGIMICEVDRIKRLIAMCLKAIFLHIQPQRGL